MKRVLHLIIFLILYSCNKKNEENDVLEQEIESSISPKTNEYLKTDKFEVVFIDTRANNLKNIKVLLKTNQKSEKQLHQ